MFEGYVAGVGILSACYLVGKLFAMAFSILNPNFSMRTFNDHTASLLGDDVEQIKLPLDFSYGIFATAEESFMCAAQMVTFSIVGKIHPDCERMISKKLQDG